MSKQASTKPKKPSITRSIRWKNETLKLLEKRAQQEGRSVNNLVNLICRTALGV